MCIGVYGIAFCAIDIKVTRLFLEELYGVVVWMGVIVCFVDHFSTMLYGIEVTDSLAGIVTIGHNFDSTIAKLQLFLYAQVHCIWKPFEKKMCGILLSESPSCAGNMNAAGNISLEYSFDRGIWARPDFHKNAGGGGGMFTERCSSLGPTLSLI